MDALRRLLATGAFHSDLMGAPVAWLANLGGRRGGCWFLGWQCRRRCRRWRRGCRRLRSAATGAHRHLWGGCDRRRRGCRTWIGCNSWINHKILLFYLNWLVNSATATGEAILMPARRGCAEHPLVQRLGVRPCWPHPRQTSRRGTFCAISAQTGGGVCKAFRREAADQG